MIYNTCGTYAEAAGARLYSQGPQYRSQHLCHQSLVHREVVQSCQVWPPLHYVDYLLVHSRPKRVLPSREAEVQQASQQEDVQAPIVLPICRKRVP